MRQLRRLCEAVRAISPECKLVFHGVPDRDDCWVLRIQVADVILCETGAGPVEKVVPEASKKIQSLSQRILLAAAADPDERPSSIPPASPDPPPTPRRKG